MDEPDVFKAFQQELGTSAVPAAAVKALTYVIQTSNASTLMELEVELMSAADVLKSCARERYALKASISLSVISDLFLRYVTRTSLDFDSVSCHVFYAKLWICKVWIVTHIIYCMVLVGNHVD